MSILRKRGPRAVTRHHQKRHRRDLQTKRANKARRSYLDSMLANTRTGMEKDLTGIVGRLTPAMRDAQEMRGYR